MANTTKSTASFADAVIYLGKGKDDQAFHHTRDAKKVMNKGRESTGKIINKIIDTWEDGRSVQCKY